jgi:hypothetical protein
MGLESITRLFGRWNGCEIVVTGAVFCTLLQFTCGKTPAATLAVHDEVGGSKVTLTRKLLLAWPASTGVPTAQAASASAPRARRKGREQHSPELPEFRFNMMQPAVDRLGSLARRGVLRGAINR